jgi:hypothetical protein
MRVPGLRRVATPPPNRCTARRELHVAMQDLTPMSRAPSNTTLGARTFFPPRERIVLKDETRIVPGADVPRDLAT